MNGPLPVINSVFLNSKSCVNEKFVHVYLLKLQFEAGNVLKETSTEI